ncbi:MAG: amidohydrolase/deacetylase family metallohydrolase [Chloroflexota bacterium]|nr:amidohydrolase/deacetylase family metallohydrolase [Chloroflexota bacterium]
MKYDFLIKGGEVVDPGGGYSGALDVAITRNRIAAVEQGIPAEGAFQVYDATGLIVTPGLIDLHTHVYAGATYWGILADPVASRSGVTTFVDAGSVGAMTLPAFREWIVRPSRARIYAFLNISSIGLAPATHELAVLQFVDTALCVEMANRNRDVVRGIKVRMGSTVEPHGLEPMRRAVQAAGETELPLMTHIGHGPPEVDEVLGLMRPGDILTHAFTGASMKIVDDAGRLREGVRRAWDAGMVVDIGHGAGGFSFETAEAVIGAGYRPHVISTDIHQLSIRGPMFDLPTTLGKFLALGMSLPEVIGAATSRPAEVLGLQGELGTLRPGAYADVALFRLEEGRFPFYDTRKVRREGERRLRHVLTIVDGQPMAPLAVEPLAPWITETDFQRELARQGLP